MTPEEIEAWRHHVRELTFANYHYEMGVALERTHDSAAALEYFRRALSIRAEYPEAHFRLVSSLIRAGRKEEAHAARTRACTLDPDMAVKGVCLATVALLDGEHRDEVNALLETAAQLFPAHVVVVALYDLQAMAEHGRVNAGAVAARLPDWARDALGDLSPTIFGRIEQVGDAETVGRAANRFLEWGIERPEILLALAKASLDLGDRTVSVKACRRCASLSSLSAKEMVRCGVLLQTALDVPGSIEVLDRALHLPEGPHVPGIFTHLTNSLFGVMRLAEADTILQSAPEEYANTSEILVQKGLVALASDDGTASRSFLQRARDSDSSPWVQTQLGLALLKTGDADQGLGLIQDARGNAGTDIVIESYEGLALLCVGRIQEAIELLSKGAARQPFSWLLTNLALALEADGRQDEAREAHRQAFALVDGYWLEFHARLRPEGMRQRINVAYKALGFCVK